MREEPFHVDVVSLSRSFIYYPYPPNLYTISTHTPRFLTYFILLRCDRHHKSTCYKKSHHLYRDAYVVAGVICVYMCTFPTCVTCIFTGVVAHIITWNVYLWRDVPYGHIGKHDGIHRHLLPYQARRLSCGFHILYWLYMCPLRDDSIGNILYISVSRLTRYRPLTRRLLVAAWYHGDRHMEHHHAPEPWE